MKKKSTLFTLLTLFSLNKLMAFDSYQTYRGSPMNVQFLLNYYKTEANFDSSGSRQNLISGNSLQALDFSPEIRYRFDSDWGLFSGLNVTNSESTDAFYTRKNSVLNQFKVGADYLFMRSIWYRLFGQLSYSHPLQKIDTNTDDVLTSDGASEINPELYLNLDFEDDLYSFLKTGLILRGEGLSTLATYGIGSEIRFDGFGFGAALLGQLSIKNDQYTEQASYRDGLNARVDAGSLKYNSINPNSHNLEVYFNFLTGSHFQTKIFAGYNLVGSNTSVGYNVGVNMNWLIDFEGDERSISKPIRVHKNEDKSNFKIDTNDGVNQDYFKPVQPIQKEYIQQIEGSPKSLKEATTPDPEEKPKKNVISQPQYQIKLKKIKKK